MIYSEKRSKVIFPFPQNKRPWLNVKPYFIVYEDKYKRGRNGTMKKSKDVNIKATDLHVNKTTEILTIDGKFV